MHKPCGSWYRLIFPRGDAPMHQLSWVCSRHPLVIARGLFIHCVGVDYIVCVHHPDFAWFAATASVISSDGILLIFTNV